MSKSKGIPLVAIVILGLVLVSGFEDGFVTAIIDRQLFTIEEQEDNSIEVYDRSNNTQIAGFDNLTEMLSGMPQVIDDMTDYYSDRNVTDIVVIR